LPAIRVAWWDVVNNKLATAELLKRIVDVLPGVAIQKPVIAGGGATGARRAIVRKSFAPVQAFLVKIVSAKTAFPILHGLIGVLTVLLSLFVFLRLRPQRKVYRSKTVAPEDKRAEKPIAEGALKRVRTAEELKDFLQAYAYEHWCAPKNASLETIFFPLRNSRAGQDIETVAREIGAALYASKAVDLEDLKTRCRRIITVQRKHARGNQKGGEKLPLLNPS